MSVSPADMKRRHMTAADGPGWAVTDYEGNPLPGRWATKADAMKHGYAGKYLFSGCEVVRVRS